MPKGAGQGDGRRRAIEDVEMDAGGTVAEEFVDLMICPSDADRFGGTRVVIDDLQLFQQRGGQR